MTMHRFRVFNIYNLASVKVIIAIIKQAVFWINISFTQQHYLSEWDRHWYLCRLCIQQYSIICIFWEAVENGILHQAIFHVYWVDRSRSGGGAEVLCLNTLFKEQFQTPSVSPDININLHFYQIGCPIGNILQHGCIFHLFEAISHFYDSLLS